MIGEEVRKAGQGGWEGQGRLFTEIKLGCRCREERHIKHCGKQNSLLLNCMRGKAIKSKTSCVKNRGMGSVLIEHTAETFRALPKIL